MLIKQLIDNLKELTHCFAHLEKFSLNFSSSSFEICVNVLQTWPYSFLYGLLLSLWSFSLLVDFYFQVPFNFKGDFVRGQNNSKIKWLSSFKTLYDCIIRVSKYKIKTVHPSSVQNHSMQNPSSHGNAFYSISFYDCIIRVSKYKIQTAHPSSAQNHSIQNTSSHGNVFYSISFYDCIIRVSKYKIQTAHPSSAQNHSIQNPSSHGNVFYSISISPRWSSGGSGEPESYWSADRKASRARKFSLLTWFATSFGTSGIIQAKIAVMPNTMCCSKWQDNKLETMHSCWLHLCFVWSQERVWLPFILSVHSNLNFGDNMTWSNKKSEALCNARLLIFSHCCTTLWLYG